MVIKLTLGLLILVASLFGIFQAFNLLLSPPDSLAQQIPANTPLPSHSLSAKELAKTPGQQANNSAYYINQLRLSAGLTSLTQHSTLNKAAQNHAEYCALNNLQGHYQQAGEPLFTGKTPTKRAFKAGYHSGVSEVISYNQPSAEKFVDVLMSAIYHRLGLLDMESDLIGSAVSSLQKGVVKRAFVAEISNQKLETLCLADKATPKSERYYTKFCRDPKASILEKDFLKAKSNIAKHNPKLLVWPVADSTVPPVFFEESPDPLPNCNVSGYPVHIQINPLWLKKIQPIIGSFKLYQLKGHQKISVPLQARMSNLTDPNHKSKTSLVSWAAIFPKRRLKWNGHYEARVQYKLNQQIHTLRWQFFTPKQPNLIRITYHQASGKPIPVKVGTINTLYFEPNSCQAPKKVSIKVWRPSKLKLSQKFIDPQTLKLRVKTAKIGDKIKIEYLPAHTKLTLIVVQ